MYFLSQLMKIISGVSSMDADINCSFGNSILNLAHGILPFHYSFLQVFGAKHYNGQYSFYLSQVKKQAEKISSEYRYAHT